MSCKHFVAFAVLTLCLAEEQGKRQTRNPGLLHLAHVGQSVGSYVTAGPRQSGQGGGGSGGPHIVIVGGQAAHVTTHVAGKDSLEELEDDLRQHYGRFQGSGVRYVPNSSFQGHFQNLGYLAAKDTQRSPYSGSSGQEYTTFSLNDGHNSSPITHGLVQGGSPHGVQNGITYRVTPVIYNHPSVNHAHPVPAYTQASTYGGHPISNLQGGAQVSAPHYGLTSVTHAVTPTPSTYASPTQYSATPSPLSHTLTTPVVSHAVVPARLLHHPYQGRVAPHLQGVRYQTPLSQAPIFVPVQAVAHRPQYQHRFALNHQTQYSSSHPSEGGSRPQSYGEEHQSGEEERRYYEDSQERRPVENYQRDFDSSSAERTGGYSQENTEHSKYGDESAAKSASYPSEEKESYEESSDEAASGEGKGNSGTYQYSFADDHGTTGRSFNGHGKVATSYQSVTLETHQPSQHFYDKHH